MVVLPMADMKVITIAYLADVAVSIAQVVGEGVGGPDAAKRTRNAKAK